MLSWFVHPSDHQPPLPRFPHSGYVRSPSWTRGCKGEQQPRDRKHHSDSENTEPLLKIERSQSQQPWATASYVGSERTRRPCLGNDDSFPRKWWGISERTKRPLLKILRPTSLNEANQANKQHQMMIEEWALQEMWNFSSNQQSMEVYQWFSWAVFSIAIVRDKLAAWPHEAFWHIRCLQGSF